MKKLKALFKLICPVVPLFRIGISAVRIVDLSSGFSSLYNMKNVFIAMCLIVSFFSLSTGGHAQQVSVQADQFTGTATVGIPLYTIRNGDVGLPVSLVYAGSGLKVQSTDGSAGMGWNIVAGGEVRRELHDLPDDSKMDGYVNGNQRLGWLYNNNGNKIAALSLANDNNASTCTDEQTDIGYISTNFGDLSDTEPDVFNVSGPGLSCRLVFDKDHVLRPVPYQDLKISYELETGWDTNYASYGRIKSFTIINDRGMKYYFSDQELSVKTAQTSADPSTIKYFKREFEQYRNSVQFNSAWKLTVISDANDNFVQISYNWTGLDYANTRLALATGNSTVPEYPFSLELRSNHGVLDKVYYNDHEGLILFDKNFSFKYRTPIYAGPTESMVIDSVKGYGQTIAFEYSVVNKRAILSRVKSNTGTNYSFTYYTDKNNLLKVPDSTSRSVDAWGYYNGSGAATLFSQIYINPSNPALERYRYRDPGATSVSFPYSLSGSDRSSNLDSMRIGSLKKISNVHGGSTSLIYESNDYYDPSAGAVVQGGGLRLKQVIDSDGNPANDLVQTYSYINPATGLSSGKAVSLPILAFTVPYTGGGSSEQQVQNSTVRLEESISPEVHYVGYSHVRLSRSGMGNVLNEYSLPATQWDSSAPGGWAPTSVNIGRPSCVASGLLGAERSAYPFVPNPNYDYGRGLLLKSTAYNDAAQKVSETSYSYQLSGAPVVVYGLKYDMNSYVMAYAKYSLVTSTGNRIISENRREYDTLTGQFRDELVTTDYESANHRLPTLQTTVNSQGDILRLRTRYVKDYTPGASGDDNSVAVYNLQQRNANFALEHISQIERNGANRTFSADRQLFKPHASLGKTGMNVISKSFFFSSMAGVTDFSPSGITGGVSQQDSRYLLSAEYLDHDAKGIALSVRDRSKQVQTTITDYNINQPVALIVNARAGEIAFNDFDTRDLDQGFLVLPTAGTMSANGHSGGFSLSFGPANFLRRTIVKNTGAQSYIFSGWISSATAGNLSLTLSDGNGTVLTRNLAFAASGVWRYYELKIPVATLAGQFTAKVEAGTNILIDDILFYPEKATVSSFSYDSATGNKRSETGSNGRPTYFTYDSRGRLKHTVDQDGNILKNMMYGTAEEAGMYSVDISTGLFGTVSYNTPVNFYDSGGFVLDMEGTRYVWDFGDGSPLTETYAARGGITHLFAGAGTFNVTLTKYSPVFGTVSGSKSVAMTDGGSEMVGVSVSGLSPGNGTITGVKFYKNSVLEYNFTQSQLTSGTVQVSQGRYTVDIEVTGNMNSDTYPFGYRSLRCDSYFTGFTYKVAKCTYARSGNVRVYSVPIDLNGKKILDLYTSDVDCVSLPEL
jgi:YD repeat-containing protein